MGPQIFELTGYPAEQWSDFNSWTDRIHPDDKTETINYCQIETQRVWITLLSTALLLRMEKLYGFVMKSASLSKMAKQL